MWWRSRVVACALLAWACLGCVLTSEFPDERLIGWQGEVPARSGPAVDPIPPQHSGLEFNNSRWIETLSWRPRVEVFHNFLSDEECKHLIRAAAPHLKPSMVAGKDGQQVPDPIRTSYGAFLRRLQDETIGDIQKRVATWTHLPMVNQEDMQVLRYGLGQKYQAHYDSHEDHNTSRPKGRMATVLMYLNDCPEGGETAFPRSSEWVDPMLPIKYGPFSPCARGHVAWKPRKGSALLFFTLTPDGKQDEASLHAGCPVQRGFKWTATIWNHYRAFQPERFARPHPNDSNQDPGICRDYNSLCEVWAAEGACEKNRAYMVMPQGVCRKACKACRPCAPDDVVCMNENRRAAGVLILSRQEMDALGVDLH